MARLQKEEKMQMQPSVKLAIATAKRNARKYSPIENMLNSIYTYYLNDDEIPTLVKSFNKWAEKNFCQTVNLQDVIESK